MSPEVPAALQQGADKETLVDACYFVIRTLRNVGRGYQSPLVSTESTEGVRILADQVISEIEAREGKPIQDLPRSCIGDYIAVLDKFAGETYQRAVGHDTQRAEIILSEMRSSRPAD